MKKNMIVRVLIWIITFMWMVGIFFLSARPASVSIQDSAKVMVILGLSDSYDEAVNTENSVEMNIQMFIRKQAHLILYMGMAILFFLSLYGYVGKSDKTAVVSFIFTVLYAISDEIHQIFSQRGAQIRDVIIDAKGAVWGLMIIVLVFIVIENVDSIRDKINKVYKVYQM